MLCGQQTLVGEAGGHGVLASLQCRCWSCPDCEPRNRAKLKALVVELDPTFHVIFTSNPHWFNSPEERARQLSAAWSTCRRRLRRRFGQAFDFVAVFAATRRGEPHIHLAVHASLLEANTLQRVLREWMYELVSAPSVVVKPVFDAAKLSRYICRPSHIYRFLGCRRFWTSRGWRVAKWAADAPFAFLAVIRSPLATAERALVAAGRVIIDRSPLRLRTLLPFSSP